METHLTNQPTEGGEPCASKSHQQTIPLTVDAAPVEDASNAASLVQSEDAATTPTPLTDARESTYAQARLCIQRSMTEWMTLVPADFARSLETTLAQTRKELAAKPRVEQCCECNGYVSDWVEAEHTNGRICRPCETLITVRKELAEAEEEHAGAEARLEVANAWIVDQDIKLSSNAKTIDDLRSVLDFTRRRLQDNLIGIIKTSGEEGWLDDYLREALSAAPKPGEVL